MMVSVNMPSERGFGCQCDVSVTCAWTAADLKMAVQDQEGIPTIYQRLYTTMRPGINGSGAGELPDSMLLFQIIWPTKKNEIWLLRRHPEHAGWISRVTLRGMSLSCAAPYIKKDRDIALKAVENDGRALQFVHNKLKKDKGLVLAAVRQDGYALKFADHCFAEDREVVQAAIEQNGLALSFASSELQKDAGLVTAAIAGNGTALQFCI